MEKWKCGKSNPLATLHYTRTNESPRTQRDSEQLTFTRVAISNIRSLFVVHTTEIHRNVCATCLSKENERKIQQNHCRTDGKCDGKPEMSSRQLNSLAHIHKHPRALQRREIRSICFCFRSRFYVFSVRTARTAPNKWLTQLVENVISFILCSFNFEPNVHLYVCSLGISHSRLLLLRHLRIA